MVDGRRIMSSEKYRRSTTVIRIPREAFDEAEKLRKSYLHKSKNGSDVFALIAVAGISAFIGGLIGYAVANLQQQQQPQKESQGEKKNE